MTTREQLLTELEKHVDPDLYAYVVCNCEVQFHTTRKYIEHLADVIEPLLPRPDTFRSAEEQQEKLNSFLNNYGRLPE